jgi:hypothetical protein
MVVDIHRRLGELVGHIHRCVRLPLSVSDATRTKKEQRDRRGDMGTQRQRDKQERRERERGYLQELAQRVQVALLGRQMQRRVAILSHTGQPPCSFSIVVLIPDLFQTQSPATLTRTDISLCLSVYLVLQPQSGLGLHQQRHGGIVAAQRGQVQRCGPCQPSATARETETGRDGERNRETDIRREKESHLPYRACSVR